MRLPAWNTLLTSPLATHVWSGVSLTAAAARGRAPTKPPAMRATPATTAPKRWRRRGRRTRAVKAAARPEDWFTQMLLAEGGPASPGGERRRAGRAGESGGPVPIGAPGPPADGDAAGEAQQDQKAHAEQDHRGGGAVVLPGEGRLETGGGSVGRSRAGRGRGGIGAGTEEPADTGRVEPVGGGDALGGVVRDGGILVVGAGRSGMDRAGGGAGRGRPGGPRAITRGGGHPHRLPR